MSNSGNMCPQKELEKCITIFLDYFGIFFFPLESITYQMNIYLLMIHYTPIITKTFIFRCKLKKVLKVTSCLQCLEVGRNIKPTRINKMVHLQFTSWMKYIFQRKFTEDSRNKKFYEICTISLWKTYFTKKRSHSLMYIHVN